MFSAVIDSRRTAHLILRDSSSFELAYYTRTLRGGWSSGETAVDANSIEEIDFPVLTVDQTSRLVYVFLQTTDAVPQIRVAIRDPASGWEGPYSVTSSASFPDGAGYPTSIEQADGLPIVAPDAPGHGESPALRAQVGAINIRRRALYSNLAASKRAAPHEVGIAAVSGLPFLLVGVGIRKLMGALAFVRRNYHWFAGISGVLMIGIGLLIATNLWTRILAPVFDLIGEALPVTLTIFITGTVIGWVVGELLGRIGTWSRRPFSGATLSVLGILSATIFPPFLVFVHVRGLPPAEERGHVAVIA